MYMNRTLKSLLEETAIAAIAPDAISKRDLSKEEFCHWTLQDIADKMGWRNLNSGFVRLFRAAQTGAYYYSLYTEEECKGAPSKKNANIVYLPSQDPAADNRPFLLLVPGGGFVNVWNLTEGWPIAHLFNGLGYHVFVLTYQVDVEATAVRAMGDMARALEIIAKRKDEFHVNPARYITCGFSAGGYVVCLWNTQAGYSAFSLPKPQACFPVYPFTSYRLLADTEWDDDAEKDLFAKAGTGCPMEEACNSCFEIPLHPEGFPPTAIFVTAQDQLVDPEHSRQLERALLQAGIPCRMEMGPTGGHGFADGEGMCMEGWPGRAIEWFEQLK